MQTFWNFVIALFIGALVTLITTAVLYVFGGPTAKEISLTVWKLFIFSSLD